MLKHYKDYISVPPLYPSINYPSINHPSINRGLRWGSTLLDLRLHDFHVGTDCLGNEVEQVFEANPHLPGVILIAQEKLLGMISRRRFFEHLSRPFARELFLKRPISSLYTFAKTELLQFSGSAEIVDAAAKAVQRQSDLLYEPIVVQLSNSEFKLIDVPQLLLAQAQIHELAKKKIEELHKEAEEAKKELQRLATIDGLTQVANRRRFDEYLDQQWQQLVEEKAPLSLILCDIDYFKRYNDTYGHQAGDDCLQKVASVLDETVQRREDLVARYGGEEFAVVLPHTPCSGAITVANAIREQVKSLHISHRGSPLSNWVTLSLGVASIIPTQSEKPASLIAAADSVLYLAKEQGRDRCMFQTQ